MPLDITGVLNTAVAPTPGVSADIVIVSQPSLNVAPAPYLLEIGNFVGFDTPAPAMTQDERYHKFDYVWDFGDPGTFARAERIKPAFRNRNLMYGPLGKHVYGEGGFTATCTITERSSGKVAVATISITVSAQDTAFTGTNTIFIDTTGAGTGAPSGALVRTSLNWDDLTGQQTTPKRAMFRGGQTHTLPGIALNGREKSTIFLVGEPGTRPALTSTGDILWEDALNNQAAQSKDFIVSGLDISTGYDSATRTGEVGERLLLAGGQSDSLNWVLFDDMDIDGVTTLFQSQASLPNVNYALYNSRLRDWSWNGHLCTMLKSFSIIGSACYHRETAANYSQDDTNTLYGLWRVTAQYGVIKKNWGFNRHGWFSNIASINETQPIGRCNPNNYNGAKWDIQENAFEAGVEVLSFRPTDHNDTNAMNVILERNDLVTSCFGSRVIAATHRGITMRNNNCYHPESDNLVYWPGTFVEYIHGGNALSADAAASETRIYNNTMFNLKTDANFANGQTANASPSTVQILPVLNLGGVPSSGQITEANNVRHQPNVSGGTPDAPLDMTATFNSQFRDYFDVEADGSIQTGPLVGTGSALATRVEARPLTGSAAIGSAVTTDPDLVAYRDFDGNVRPAQPSRGALEPA